MFAIYNNMTRGSLIKFFLYLCLFVFIVVAVIFFLLSPHFFLTTYLTLVITLLLLLLKLCLLILPLCMFLRNQVGESSKQGIQAALSTLFIVLSNE